MTRLRLLHGIDAPTRTLAEAEREIAANIARHKMRHLRVDGRPIEPAQPVCKLLVSRANEPTRIQPCITPAVRQRIFGRSA